MSIAITLLGHSPRKKDGYSSGTGGAGIDGFLHLAYANSEEGEGFTKTNINEDGHIAFYPYIGMCISEDRDDDNLSFHSYEWSNVGYGDTSSQEGGTPNGTGNNGSGGNGNNESGGNTGCSCETCCNYQYCPDGANGNVDPLAILNPQTVEYDKPLCLYPTEGYVMDKNYHLLFDDEVRSVGYEIIDGDPKSIQWKVWLKCHNFKIKIEKALDIYQGWIYYADIVDFYSEIFHVYVNLNQKLTEESDYTLPEDPQWHVIPFSTNPLLGIGSRLSYPTAIEDNVAKWRNPVIESLFGASKTERLHECHNEGLGYYSVYDTTIKYRWKASTYEELVALLPNEYSISYNDMERFIPFEYTGETGATPVMNLVTNKINNSPYYDSTSANKQGARLQSNHPDYTGWQNDWYEVDDSNWSDDVQYTGWVRFYNGYDNTWLDTIYSQGGTVVPDPADPNDNRTDAEIIEENMSDAPDRIYDDTFGTIVKNYDLTTHSYCYTVVLNDDHYDLYDNGSTVNLLKFKDADNTFSITMNPNNDYSYTIKLLKPVDSYPNTITFSNQGQSDIVITKSYRDGDYLHPVYSMPDSYISTFVYSPSHGKFIPGFPYNNQISQYVYDNTGNLYVSRIYTDYNTNTKVDRGDENPVTYFDPSAKKIYNYRTNHRLYDYYDLTIDYDYSNLNSPLSDHYVTIT